METKKKLLTGLQSSGTLHIGNYFGALKPFVDTYENYESHLMVADLHALTTVRDPHVLRQNIFDVVKDYTQKKQSFFSNHKCKNTQSSHGCLSVL